MFHFFSCFWPCAEFDRSTSQVRARVKFESRSSQFFFQAEDGIRDVERSRGLGDVYKRQELFDEAADQISGRN